MLLWAVWGGIGGGAVAGGANVRAPPWVWGRVFGLRSGSRLKRTSVRRCEGVGAGWGGFLVCCRGAWVACVGVGGSPVAWRAATALALALALWMRSAGTGGSEDEVEDVDEAENEEKVVVLGDAVKVSQQVKNSQLRELSFFTVQIH